MKVLGTHKAILHKVCHLYEHLASDREDLFQEITYQVWKAWPRFRGDSRISTWIYRIALNTAITGWRRKKGRIRLMGVDNIHDVPAEEMDTEGEERRKKMYDAIRGLSEWERALVMLYLEDKSYEEMEEILGVAQNTLRVRMTRIREKLRKLTQI